MSNDGCTIVRLDAVAAELRLSELADVLADCVAGGASVSFMQPFPPEAAARWWRGLLPRMANGEIVLLAALKNDRAVGTVQLHLSTPPNQPHRADVAKMLVHRSARRLGLARRLMVALEDEAHAAGRWLLTLDTVSDGAAAPLYRSLGYQRVGSIPDYALMPDGPLCSTDIYYKRLQLVRAPIAPT